MIKNKHNLSKVILMHPNSYQKLINNDRGNELINIKFLPILNNNKISDFDKWIKIRQELSYYQNKKRNKSWNFQNEQKANPITTKTIESQTTDWIDIKPSTSKSTSKYDHSRPEKFEFPDLPPESDNEDFSSNKKENVVSDKRKVSDTSFLDSETDKKKIGLEKPVLKVKLNERQRKFKAKLQKLKTETLPYQNFKYVTGRERLMRSVRTKNPVQTGKNKLNWISYH